MSVDFQIAFPCPHLTIEERVALDEDRRSLLTRQPVMSGDFVRITANDDVDIPKEGLFASARVAGSFSGPFTIQKGRNRITIRNARGSVEDYALPVGIRVTADRVVELLYAAFRNAGLGILPVSRDGLLSFSDLDDVGPASLIDIRGDAAASLGFVNQIAAKGREVFPGWEMAEREDVINTVTINQFIQISTRYPQFVRPVKSNPVFKVTYATIQQRCRRCLSTGIENDYRFDNQGAALLLQNEDLLNQALLKILLTRRASNPFHTYYGSTLVDQIGQKALLGTSISINEDVLRTVETFKRLQTLQGQFQAITARERLAAVLSINVYPKRDDPTVFNVIITGTNASGQPVTLTTVYAAPGTAALVGSSGLSLGLEGFGLDPSTTGEIFR